MTPRMTAKAGVERQPSVSSSFECRKEQPLKQRLKKKLQRFDDKREEWVFGRKKNHTSGSIKDEAIIMLEKLHAIGYKPVLLLGKENKNKEV
ncbi:hypothetical protein Q7C36_002882 [Tachysurus vachellii]|uniref:Uncharacterized protein n=1 Tax=Tachysurus vachellii TaxID=175792 RepID=A0AA88T5F8_TACVA|nr:hypothetical protein Q7C36_002882 [Tachysurus vachellii]